MDNANPSPQSYRVDHKVKCWPQFFDAVYHGIKKHEIRNNDRGFKLGEVVRLMEYFPAAVHLDTLANEIPADTFSGRSVDILITYITTESPGLLPGYCAFSFHLLRAGHKDDAESQPYNPET